MIGDIIGFIGGLAVTLKSTWREPVTAEYPESDKRLNLEERYMEIGRASCRERV